jgi:hypothetical protein
MITHRNFYGPSYNVSRLYSKTIQNTMEIILMSAHIGLLTTHMVLIFLNFQKARGIFFSLFTL